MEGVVIRKIEDRNEIKDRLMPKNLDLSGFEWKENCKVGENEKNFKKALDLSFL